MIFPPKEAFVAEKAVAVLLPRREVFGAAGAGAISLVVRNACLHGKSRGHMTVLGGPVERPYPVVSFVPITPEFWLPGSRTARYLAGVVRTLRRLRTRVVEIHNRPKYVATVKRKLPGVSIILYLHNDPQTMKGFASAAARARLLEQTGAIVCVSGFIRARFLEGLSGHAGCSRVHVILNGIDSGRFTPPAPGGKRREIVLAGRLIPDKGGGLFAGAMVRILPELPGWKAVLIGRCGFSNSPRVTPFEQQVVDQFRRLAHQGEVTGYLEHERVMARFRDAAIAVVPSLWDDPCPLAAVEALASGCAVVATTRGGLPEVVGDAGVLLENETPEALAGVLMDLIQNDERRCDLQRRARKRAVGKLDIRAACAHLDRIRQQLLGDVCGLSDVSYRTVRGSIE